MIVSGLLKHRKPLSQLFSIQNTAQIRSQVLNNQGIGRRFYYIISSEKYTVSSILSQNFATNRSRTLNVFGESFQRKWCSKLSKSTITDVRNVQELSDEDAEITKNLFPEPRVTLKNLSDKLPDKTYDIYYKQSSVALKISKKKKGPVKNDWICSYVFKWPEQKKFECTATSKKQAAEKAATMALSWLYAMRHIDKQGKPLLADVRGVSEYMNEPIVVQLSEERVEQIRRLVQVYEGGIKQLFEATHVAAVEREKSIAAAQDSVSDDDAELTDDDLADDKVELEPTSEVQTRTHPIYGRPFYEPSAEAVRRRDDSLARSFGYFDENRVPLPIDDYISDITEALETSRSLIVAGAPGCGKSMRTPLALLRALGARAHVLVSQPRRVAATGLAASVADELGEQVGESIGYQVRLHARLPRPPGGSVLFCTSGVLLRRLQTNPGLEGCTHVIADEAHERDINSDVALLLLRRALTLNPQLKLIIMSATLDTDVFTRYFDGCPIVQVPGRTYPVEAVYLEDIHKKLPVQRLPVTSEGSNLGEDKPLLNFKEITQVITAIDETESDGAILVFLPGWSEIKSVKEYLEDKFKNSGRHFIIPVHSRLSMSDQSKMFNSAPPGVRKIVLATNIAETSITIPDVTCVVDTGASRENRMRRGSSSLELTWVSRAAAKQRMGRAGRKRPGRCYKLYTRDKESTFLSHTSPEILRVPLVKTVLDCKTYAPTDKAEDFLSLLPEPPSAEAVQSAVSDLVHLGALSNQLEQRLTSLGRLMSSFTLHPRLSCALLHSAVVGCVASAADVVTLMSTNIELFANATERREEMREIKSRYHPTSDHLALRWIAEEFSQQQGTEDVDRYCDKLGVRKERMYSLRALSNLHLEQLLKCGIAGLNPDMEELNKYSEVDELTIATILSGTDELLKSKYYVKSKGKIRKAKGLFTGCGERAHIGSDSVNRATDKRSGSELLMYWGGVRSLERRVLLPRSTSAVTPRAAILFTRDVIQGKTSEGLTPFHLQRHKLTIYVPERQADLLSSLRSMLWDTFNYFIERDSTSTNGDHVNILDFRDQLMNNVARILIEAENERLDGLESDKSR